MKSTTIKPATVTLFVFRVDSILTVLNGVEREAVQENIGSKRLRDLKEITDEIDSN